MHPKAAVDARALDAEHDAKVNAGPLGLLGPTVSTLVVARGVKEV